VNWDWQQVALTAVGAIVIAAPILVWLGIYIWQRLNAWVQLQTQELRAELRDVQAELQAKSQTCDRLVRENEILREYARKTEQENKVLNKQLFELFVQFGLLRRERKLDDDDTGPQAPLPRHTEYDVDLRILRDILEERLGPDEILLLAADTKVRSFVRSVPEAEQIQCIVDYLHKRQRLVKLFNWLAQYRPDISLDDIWRR
jgi:hypothetical protein